MRSLVILGRRWFEKVNGNTYFSVRIFIDGEQVHYEPFEYGYGNYFQQFAGEYLKLYGYLETVQVFSECKDKGIDLVIDCVDVARKKDL